MWSDRRRRNISRAAAFCTDWRRRIRWIGRPISVQLLGIKLVATRLNPFASSWFYNATAVRGVLWWLRQSHSVNYANHQHSPFARRRHDFRQAAARRFKLHFSRYRLVKVSWKSVQPFPRTVVSYFWWTEKKQKKTKKNICKTYTHPRPLAAADA